MPIKNLPSYSFKAKKTVDCVTQVFLNGLKHLSNCINLNNPISFWTVVTLCAVSIGAGITIVVTRWIKQIKNSWTQTDPEKKILFRNLSLNQVQLTPCTSPTDVRSISPSVLMPKGIANISNNSCVISVLQPLAKDETLLAHLINDLETIKNDPDCAKNPFEHFEKLRPHHLASEIAMKAKIAASLREIEPIFDKDVLLWSEEKRLNLKSLYFHITLSDAAKLAVCLLKLWAQSFDHKIEFLNQKQAQLLRLSLIKLLYHNQSSELVHQEQQDALKIPGLNYGISPIAQDDLDPQVFLKKILIEITSIAKGTLDEDYKIQKLNTYTSYEARGINLGKITKSRTRTEILSALEIRKTDELNLAEYIQSLDSLQDSRGVFDQANGKLTPHQSCFFLADGDLHPSNARSLHHERIVSGYKFDRIFFVFLTIFHSKELSSKKHHPRRILFSNEHDFEIQWHSTLKRSLQKYILKGFIAHLGPSKTAGHYITYVRKVSHGGQNVYFRCDDQIISLVQREDIHKIFNGAFLDPIWGLTTPYVLAFEEL